MIRTEKTVYDPAAPSDGLRVLVMRTWPRGISKQKVDRWVKDLGTEKELIKIWKSGGISWDEYSERYVASLKGKEALLGELAEESKRRTVTLLCACREEKHCHRHLLGKAIQKLT